MKCLYSKIWWPRIFPKKGKDDEKSKRATVKGRFYPLRFLCKWSKLGVSGVSLFRSRILVFILCTISTRFITTLSLIVNHPRYCDVSSEVRFFRAAWFCWKITFIDLTSYTEHWSMVYELWRWNLTVANYGLFWFNANRLENIAHWTSISNLIFVGYFVHAAFLNRSCMNKLSSVQKNDISREWL